MTIGDDHFHAQAGGELATNERDEYTWIEALEQNDYDDTKARVAYVRMRAKQLKEEARMRDVEAKAEARVRAKEAKAEARVRAKKAKAEARVRAKKAKAEARVRAKKATREAGPTLMQRFLAFKDGYKKGVEEARQEKPRDDLRE